MNAQIRTQIESAISHHDRFRNSYFWSSPGAAASRRAMEARESFTIEFELNGNRYEFESSVSVSCANVYYKGYFRLNGERKTVRLFKNLLKSN